MKLVAVVSSFFGIKISIGHVFFLFPKAVLVRLIYSKSVYGESFRPYETGKGHSRRQVIVLTFIFVKSHYLPLSWYSRILSISWILCQRGFRDKTETKRIKTEPKGNITESKTNKQHKVTTRNKK